MKLLYLFNLYQQPGGENLWVRSEPELFRARGHDVIIYERDNKEIQGWSLGKKAALLWQARWSRESYAAVRELIRRERPDIAHVYNTLVLLTPSVYYACRDEGVPIVQSVYNYRLLCPAGNFLREGKVCEECVEHSLLRSIRHACYRDSYVQSAALAATLTSHRRMGTWTSVIDRYLVPTAFMKRKLVENGLPAERITIKPNYHEPDPGLREETDGSVLYTGRLSEEKGIHTLVEAWKLLKNPPLLRIIGDGPLRSSLARTLADHPGLRVELMGLQNHSQVISHLKTASCFVLPSEWYEAFPHVILEAFACAVPILASRIGTLPDVITDGITGMLFDPGSPEDLASKMNWMLQHPATVSNIGIAGRHEYVTKYTADKNYERLLGIYESTARSAGTRQYETVSPEQELSSPLQ